MLRHCAVDVKERYQLGLTSELSHGMEGAMRVIASEGILCCLQQPSSSGSMVQTISLNRIDKPCVSCPKPVHQVPHLTPLLDQEIPVSVHLKLWHQPCCRHGSLRQCDSLLVRHGVQHSPKFLGGCLGDSCVAEMGLLYNWR